MFDHFQYASPVSHLERMRPDTPTMYFAPSVLNATASRFLRGFGGQVTYAVKANPRPEVLDTLAAAGITGFDVASPEEIKQVRRAAPEADLHYNNPVRSPAEVAAGKAAGVRSWSVDDPHELAKLGAPLHANEEVAVRFKLPVQGAHYDFGEKFGATPEEAATLLRAASAAGYKAALTFHPGTQCSDPAAWEHYITSAAQIAEAAGVTVERLNVGGGFASHRCGTAPDLEAIFEAIGAAVSNAFETPPALVCEPGRAMVAESFSLASGVKAIRADGSVILTDGIYGALAEWRDMSASTRITAIRADGTPRKGAQSPRKVWGPTCDSLDCLPERAALPETVREGDYLIFAGMGAYSLAIATRFNGYGPREVITVALL